jgi:spermidine synthase
VEREAALIALVEGLLPLPDTAKIDVLLDDARAAVETLPDAQFDFIINDVYQGISMPRGLVGTGFVRQIARLLAPGGVFAANIGDVPGLAHSRTHAASMCTVFDDVFMIAKPGMLAGHQHGNVVLAATMEPGRLPVTELKAATGGAPTPARLLTRAEVDLFIAAPS